MRRSDANGPPWHGHHVVVPISWRPMDINVRIDGRHGDDATAVQPRPHGRRRGPRRPRTGGVVASRLVGHRKGGTEARHGEQRYTLNNGSGASGDSDENRADATRRGVWETDRGPACGTPSATTSAARGARRTRLQAPAVRTAIARPRPRLVQSKPYWDTSSPNLVDFGDE